MLETLLYITCGIYALEYLLYTYGIFRARRLRRRTHASFPSVSIVVAARNEEANIEECLRSLLAQDYPAERLQIVAVNDESEDGTLAIMRKVHEESGGGITVISTSPERSHLGGKARALAQGIDQASGEIVFTTDADCTPPSTWISTVVSYYDDRVDAVAGFTIVKTRSLFDRLQQLDWAHLQSLGSSGLALGSPTGVIGNNFSFRKKAYEELGGYRSVRFSVTEDFALFRELHRRGKRVLFPCDRAGRVETLPCETLTQVLRQKHRWGRGGLESTPHGYTILVIAFLMLVSVCVAPFVSPAVWGIVWGVKFASDLALMFPVLREMRLLRALPLFPLFEFYFLAQALVVPVLLTNRKVVWKGRVFDTMGAKGVRVGGE